LYSVKILDLSAKKLSAIFSVCETYEIFINAEIFVRSFALCFARVSPLRIKTTSGCRSAVCTCEPMKETGSYTAL